MNALESLYKEERKSPEYETYHQNTVRIALFKMQDVRVETALLPSQEDIEMALQPGILHDVALEQAILKSSGSGIPELTGIVMEVKASGKRVVNPNQLMLPGGGGVAVNEKKPISKKEILKIARSELFEEVHLNAHGAKVLPEATYTYGFNHPKLPSTGSAGQLINTTHLVVAQGAPHDRVQYFDPRDKLQNVVGISPSQLTALFAENSLEIEGKRYPIVDSLSSNHADRMHAQVVRYSDETPFKESVETESYLYEAHIQREVLIRLLTLSKIGKSDLSRTILHFYQSDRPTTIDGARRDLAKIQKYIHRIERTLPGVTRIPDEHISHDNVTKLVARGVPLLSLSRRSALVSLMNEAIRQVRMDITTEYYKEAGPQFPLLMAHMLARIPVWGQYEYKIISKCPEIKHIVDTACGAFNIRPGEANWHEQLLEQFTQYRALEFSDNAQYKRIGKDIAEHFCNPNNSSVWRIGNPKKLGILSGKANRFIERELLALSQSISKEKLNPLSGDPLGASTSELSELMMVMLGVDQYEGNPVRNSERAAALCKMVHELHLDRVDTAAQKKTNLHIKPLRGATRAIIGAPVDTLTIEGQRYTKHHIPAASLQLPEDRPGYVYDGLLIDPFINFIDISMYDVDIVFSLREKDEFSRYRKFLSQGSIQSPESEMTDEFGFMFALDLDAFRTAITTDYPHLEGETLERIARHYSAWAIQRILLRFHDSLSKEREILHPMHELSKGRSSPELATILSIAQQEKGSAGSDSESFEWLKYAYTLTDDSGVYELEWQIFNSIDSMIRKKRNDPEYDIKRRIRFNEHRYSMVEALFGSKEAYEEAMRDFHEKRSQTPLSPESVRERFFYWLYQMLTKAAKHIEEGIIYRRNDT